MFNLIKRAVVSRKTADIGQVPISQVSWNEKAANVEVISPYGLYSNLPTDSLVLMLNVNGQEENKAAIGYKPKERFKNLKEGEIYVGNQVTGSVIKFLTNGDIDITAVNDQIINITGDSTVTVGGDVTLNVTGDVTATIGGAMSADVTGNFDATIGGTTTIDSTGNTDVTTPVFTINGELRVTGDITAFYGGTPIVLSNVKSQNNLHTHTSTTPGLQTSTTSAPI